MIETARLQLCHVDDNESFIDELTDLWTNTSVQVTYEGNLSLRSKSKLKDTASVTYEIELLHAHINIVTTTRRQCSFSRHIGP